MRLNKKKLLIVLTDTLFTSFRGQIVPAKFLPFLPAVRRRLAGHLFQDR